MDAPSSVIDTDLPRGITDTDVDDIETHSTLYASWSPVPDADSYHVGIFTIDGLALLEDTIDVGTNTEGVFEGLTLQLGQRYIVSVRAQGESGLSASTLSNGVTIVDVSDPEAECQADISQGVQGGEPFLLTYQASDVTAIEHAAMRVEALGAEATETLFELEGIRQGQLEGRWSGSTGDWPVGSTMVRFEVMDGANHKATALVELTIDEARHRLLSQSLRLMQGLNQTSMLARLEIKALKQPRTLTQQVALRRDQDALVNPATNRWTCLYPSDAVVHATARKTIFGDWSLKQNPQLL